MPSVQIKHGQCYLYNFECTAETKKAILVTDGLFEWRIPQSQVIDDSEVYKKGDKGTLVITEWFATKVEIIDYADEQPNEV